MLRKKQKYSKKKLNSSTISLTVIYNFHHLNIYIIRTIQYKKWAAKTDSLDAKIKDEQAKIAELEKILANRKEPNEIEREILRMQYSIEERDRVICEKEREISVKDNELEKLRVRSCIIIITWIINIFN